MAMNLKRTASGASKRKAGELDGDTLEIEIPKELIKKRKVPQMAKGWAYVDEDMERQRREEAEKDKQLRLLQREGRVAEDVKILRPKYPSRSAVASAAAAETGRKFVTKAKDIIASAKTSTKDKGTTSTRARSNTLNDEDEPKPNKPGILSRGIGSIKRRGSQASAIVNEKRRSTLSTNSSLRQSTLNFQQPQQRNTSGASGEALLPSSSRTSAADNAAKRASFMSLASAKSKRASTVRLVENDDDEEDAE